LDVSIAGRPHGQGSMSGYATPGTSRVRMVHPRHTRDHRDLVVGELRRAWGREPLRGPVHVDVELVFARPKAHYGTGRNSELLKPSAPEVMSTGLDLDKGLRLIGDSLVLSGVIVDDRQIFRWAAVKSWGGSDVTRIAVWGLPDP
jgi:Holliday junction resolvase RusA-like endonuclease